MKKFNQTLITLLLLISIAFVGLSCYKKIVDIQQAEFDLKYKETVNSSIEYPYDCIYRRLNRQTGEVHVIVSYLDEENGFVSGVVQGNRGSE